MNCSAEWNSVIPMNSHIGTFLKSMQRCKDIRSRYSDNGHEIGLDRVQVSNIFSKSFSILHTISIRKGGERGKKSFCLSKRKKLGANEMQIIDGGIWTELLFILNRIFIFDKSWNKMWNEGSSNGIIQRYILIKRYRTYCIIN